MRKTNLIGLGIGSAFIETVKSKREGSHLKDFGW
jgi:hypothetical protein